MRKLKDFADGFKDVFRTIANKLPNIDAGDVGEMCACVFISVTFFTIVYLGAYFCGVR
jgi:hypothetical protein